jgi:hypothetical protein
MANALLNVPRARSKNNVFPKADSIINVYAGIRGIGERDLYKKNTIRRDTQ